MRTFSPPMCHVPYSLVARTSRIVTGAPDSMRASRSPGSSDSTGTSDDGKSSASAMSSRTTPGAMKVRLDVGTTFGWTWARHARQSTGRGARPPSTTEAPPANGREALDCGPHDGRPRAAGRVRLRGARNRPRGGRRRQGPPAHALAGASTGTPALPRSALPAAQPSGLRRQSRRAVAPGVRRRPSRAVASGAAWDGRAAEPDRTIEEGVPDQPQCSLSFAGGGPRVSPCRPAPSSVRCSW